jgi:hypothetical protein
MALTARQRAQLSAVAVAVPYVWSVQVLPVQPSSVASLSPS